MKKGFIGVAVLLSLILLSSCVTAKNATELVDQRLEELYPGVDFDVLNTRTAELAQQQEELSATAAETEQKLTTITETIDEKAAEGRQSLHTIIRGGTETLKNQVASLSDELSATVLGSVETVNKATEKAEQRMQTITSGNISTLKERAQNSIESVKKVSSDAEGQIKTLASGTMETLSMQLKNGEQTMHTLVSGSVTEIENARLKAYQQINTVISGGLELIAEASDNALESMKDAENALKAELLNAKENTGIEISGHRAQAKETYDAYLKEVDTAVSELTTIREKTETFLKGLEKEYKDYILGLINNEGQALYNDINAEKNSAIQSIKSHQIATENKIDATESYMSGLKVEFQKYIDEQVKSIENMKSEIQKEFADYQSKVDTMSIGAIQRVNTSVNELESKFLTLEKQYDSLVVFLQGLAKLQ